MVFEMAFRARKPFGTLAKRVPVPAERNRPDVIQRRIDYATWFLENDVVSHCVLVMNAALILDSSKTWTSEKGRESLQSSAWTAWTKCYCKYGNFTDQRSRLPHCNSLGE